MKPIEFTIISGRKIFVNPDQIVYICADELNATSCQIFLSNNDHYTIKLLLKDVLKELDYHCDSERCAKAWQQG